MTRLFLVKDGEQELWVAALVEEDVLDVGRATRTPGMTTTS